MCKVTTTYQYQQLYIEVVTTRETVNAQLILLHTQAIY